MIKKISNYLCEYSEWDYSAENWKNDSFPSWTFSGNNSDDLTNHVMNCCLYGLNYEENEENEENNWLNDLSFYSEEDRIDSCYYFAEKISKTIELI